MLMLQELTKEIGEALCALIDEGADQEGRPKRKLGPDGMVTQVTKKTRELTGEGLYGQRLPPAPAAGPGLPLMYHPPSMAPPEAFASARPIVRPSGSFPSKPMQTSDHPRPSRSRSPHLAPSEKRARELIRDRERGSDKERTRSRSSSRSVDLAAEEDLLNMVRVVCVILETFCLWCSVVKALIRIFTCWCSFFQLGYTFIIMKLNFQ
jgi:hypothetical protein